jgi:hypothetical protein
MLIQRRIYMVNKRINKCIAIRIKKTTTPAAAVAAVTIRERRALH